MPEPSQASWPVGVLRPGLVIMPGLVPVPVLVSMPAFVPVPGFVPDLHDIQDAWLIRLQHVNNSHPSATANYAQRRHPPVRRAAGGTGVGRPPPR